MSLRKGTPGEGWTGACDSFSYTSVAPGLKGWFTGWMAGPVYWTLAHEHTDRTPGTKPCLDWMTEGAVRCPRCNTKKLPVWIGYLPLYREQDLKPVFVILHQNALDQVEGLSYPDHLVVGRVEDKSGVFVRKSDTAARFSTSHANRKVEFDITRDLVPMWRLPQLEEWLEKTTKQKRREKENAEHAARLRLSVPPPTTDAEALAIDAERKAPSDWSDTVDFALRGMKQGRVTPSSNGKHEGGT